MIGYTDSLLLWWHPQEPGNLSKYEYDCEEHLSMRHYLPDKWHQVRIIQVLRSSEHIQVELPRVESIMAQQPIVNAPTSDLTLNTTNPGPRARADDVTTNT